MIGSWAFIFRVTYIYKTVSKNGALDKLNNFDPNFLMGKYDASSIGNAGLRAF